MYWERIQRTYTPINHDTNVRCHFARRNSFREIVWKSTRWLNIVKQQSARALTFAIFAEEHARINTRSVRTWTTCTPFASVWSARSESVATNSVKCLGWKLTWHTSMDMAWSIVVMYAGSNWPRDNPWRTTWRCTAPTDVSGVRKRDVSCHIISETNLTITWHPNTAESLCPSVPFAWEQWRARNRSNYIWRLCMATELTTNAGLVIVRDHSERKVYLMTI